MADKPASERPDIFPPWYFDSPSDRQLERMKAEGIMVPPNISKGKASDLIGLTQPIGYNDAKVLTFFKRSTRGVSEAQGRHEAALLLADPVNLTAWEAKPPDTMQREFFRWFGITLPKGMTQDQVSDRIREERERLPETELDYWAIYEDAVSELDDPEVRKDYEIKKVSLGVIREAVIALRAEGHSADDLEGALYLITDKIIESRPDLMRG